MISIFEVCITELLWTARIFAENYVSKAGDWDENLVRIERIRSQISSQTDKMKHIRYVLRPTISGPVCLDVKHSHEVVTNFLFLFFFNYH
jgi:hypothetical protein